MIRPFKAADLPIIMDIANRAWQRIHESAREIYGDELFEIICQDENMVEHGGADPLGAVSSGHEDHVNGKCSRWSHYNVHSGSNSLSRIWPHRLARSRTSDSHSENTGSNPVGAASRDKGWSKKNLEKVFPSRKIIGALLK